MNKNCLTLSLALATLALILPETALAGGIAEMTGPLQTIVNTFMGPVGRLVVILALVLFGVFYALNRQEMNEGMKLASNVIFGGIFIALATQIADALFSFGGALV